jgi:GNAT superfamily N-acetyltransferase
MAVSIEPLTPGLWGAFEDLFGKQGACYGCWCTYFRLPPSARRASSGMRNKDIIRARIEAGPPPGLLALEDGKALGWMQIGPRADVPEWNNRGRASAPVADGGAADPAVWAISCFFIRTDARGRGLSHLLVAGGVEHARRSGARLVEACPIRESKDARSLSLFVGSARVFDKAGFTTMVERKSGRPLMRLELAN